VSTPGTESEFEQTTLDRLVALGYRHVFGFDLERPHTEVVLRDRLRASFADRYPDLPPAALDTAVSRVSLPDGADTLRRNKSLHELLVRGFELKVERPDGQTEFRHLYPIDWDHPERNEFLAVNQFPVKGQNDRRPDILLFVNGLPLVLFELKNPYSEHPDAAGAFNQIQHYRNDIPRLFEFNALVVVSDGVDTLHGQWPADWEWYAPWKSIDGFAVTPGTVGSMKALVEGLLPPARLLEYVRDFVVFEEANDRLAKKAAKYHQFFAVRLAADRAVKAYSAADKRVGVVWHTTGSGKSLSMLFLVARLRRLPELHNPSFVIQVDRTDLDDQLHDQFVAGRSLVGAVRHAESVDELRELLQSGGGEVIFSTIEKFRLKGVKDKREKEHPVLSERDNVFVVADEAHRTQYGTDDGYARWLRVALPNAKRLGFTGTPVSFAGKDTVEVFGDVIHTYDIRQAQEDRATVPIWYAPRQVRLHLKKKDLDAALAELSEGHDLADLEKRKAQWAALAVAAGAGPRVEELAKDLLAHFLDRTATLAGKAMVVCMTRSNCVKLYDELVKLPGCPEARVVMTGNLAEDPKEWSAAGHLTTKEQRDAIKQRMVEADDPLRIVIVCDMWLTGTDIPCLHTLYVDKPMRGHNMIQAISRVNRLFRDKPHGLIVDYIGIGDDLRAATAKYTQGGGTGTPAPNLDDTARPEFLRRLADVRKLLPDGYDYAGWRKMQNVEREDLDSLVLGHLAEDDELREEFFKAEQLLSLSFLLVKHLDDCRPHADEVIYYQRVRKPAVKSLPGRKPPKSLERAVRDLVDESVGAAGVVDVFKAAGLEKADLSILDDRFLQTFRDRPNPNLRLKLLEQLMRDEIRQRQPKNLAQAKSFQQLLENTLTRYHNRLIDAAAVIEAMMRIRKEMTEADERAAALGLEADEVAFYDAVAANYGTVYEPGFLRDLIHDVVQTLKRNLKVDWTAEHRDQVKAEVRAAVKRVLRSRGVKADDLELMSARIMEQAAATFAEWPLLAV
jgi:type I restriction enzyme R subunit